MPETLEYGRPDERPKLVWLAFWANATIVYPLFIVALLYFVWLPARAELGRSPRPMVDSVRNATSMGGLLILYFGLVTGPIVALGSLFANIAHIVTARMSFERATVQLIVMLSIWIGAAMLLYWDPFQALACLMD